MRTMQHEKVLQANERRPVVGIGKEVSHQRLGALQLDELPILDLREEVTLSQGASFSVRFP